MFSKPVFSDPLTLPSARQLDELVRRGLSLLLDLAVRAVLRLSRLGGLMLAVAGLSLLRAVGEAGGMLDFPSFLVFGLLGVVSSLLGSLRVLLPTPQERIRRLQARFDREDRRLNGGSLPSGPTHLDIMVAPTPFHVCTRCRVVTSGAGLCDCCLGGTGIVPVVDEGDRRTALVALGFVEPDDGGLPWAELDALVPG